MGALVKLLRPLDGRYVGEVEHVHEAALVAPLQDVTSGLRLKEKLITSLASTLDQAFLAGNVS